MMLAILKKKRGANAAELLKSLGKRFDEINEQERIIGIDTTKPLSLQDPNKTSSLLRKRKRTMETKPGQYIVGIHYNKTPHEGVPFRETMQLNFLNAFSFFQMYLVIMHFRESLSCI